MHDCTFAEVVLVGYAVVHLLTMYGLWNEECMLLYMHGREIPA